MKQIELLIAAALIITGCGQAQEDSRIESEFQPYVDSFTTEAIKYGKPVSFEGLSVVFTDDERYAGLCSGGTVKVNRIFWANSEHHDREQLLFHEFGHCVLGLDHVLTPSIMHSSMLGQWYYLAHRDALVAELFN